MGWYPEIKDQETLAKSAANLSAYQWTTVPAQTLHVGDNLRRLPNMADRKFTQDIPFSVCLVSLLGEYMGVPTPTFDRNVQYMQAKMGKDYIRFAVSGKEPGMTSNTRLTTCLCLLAKSACKHFWSSINFKTNGQEPS